MFFLLIVNAFAEELSVQSGDSIQDTLNQAQAGDTITIESGTYEEQLISINNGSEGAPITLRAADGAEVLITQPGEVLQIEHSWWRVEGIIFDGQYGNKDVLDIRDGANNLILSGIEVRHSSRDCIDIGTVIGF